MLLKGPTLNSPPCLSERPTGTESLRTVCWKRRLCSNRKIGMFRLFLEGTPARICPGSDGLFFNAMPVCSEDTGVLKRLFS